jgi:DNA-binding transcriptional ArsR family regulator
MTPGPIVPEIDSLLHEPARLRILALLAMVERADFMYLLRTTGLSRGNLSVQLSKLEDAGVVHLDRQLVGTRPRTTYFLSEQGVGALIEYKRTILNLLDPIPE